MTVALKNNFFATARGLTFEDSTSVTWSLNANTNQLTATALTAGASSNLAGGAAGSLPYQSAANTTAMLPVGSTGQLLTVSGGLPAWEAVPTWNQNTTGTAANVTGTVAIAHGGTGQTTALTGFEALSPMTTIGDMIYAPGAGTATRLPIGTSNQFLTVAGGIPSWTSFTAAAPSGTIGLTAVTGSTGSWMDAGSAPKLSQAIAPTWTGIHLFTGAINSGFSDATSAVMPGAIGGSPIIAFVNSGGGANVKVYDNYVDSSGNMFFRMVNDTYTGANIWMSVTRTGTTPTGVTIGAPLAINGGTPTTQPTGYGSPSGSPTASLTSAATLAQTAGTLAALLAYLKTIGFITT
jgi:hypothetical protein